MNGAELLVHELQKRGVSFISTLVGHGLDPLLAACRKAGLRLVDVRNEQAAAYMAEAAGRLSRRVGVCAVSSGVAHANALTGVVNAYFDGSPMLLITGCGSTETIGLGHFQDLDQVALAAPVCKYARIIDRSERIQQVLHEAFSAAESGRPGPVHLTFPLDVQTAEVDPEGGFRIPEAMVSKTTAHAGDEDRIARAAKLISEAERPLLIAGSGVYYAEGEEALASFVRSLSIPVVVPIWDRGAILQPMEEFMGVLGAATGGPPLLHDADLILMVGARCDYRLGFLQPPAIRKDARIVSIHTDPNELLRRMGVHLPILGDPRSVIRQLSKASRDRNISPKTPWLEEARSRRERFRQEILDAHQSGGGGLHALDIIRALESVVTEETILLIDGGNIGQWVHQMFCDRYPGHWLTCGSSGVVGWGIPGAMAARVLYPDRPVVLVSGDGAFTFTVSELETSARQQLGFVVVLADDQAWGVTLTGHMRKWGKGIVSELGPIRFDQLADAFGACGVRVENAEEIVPAIRQGLGADRPTVVHVPVRRSNPADR